MTFSELYIKTDGRIGRKSFWVEGLLPLYLWYLCLGFLITALLNFNAAHAGSGALGSLLTGAILYGLFPILFLLPVWPNIVLLVKRYHDLNKSGWWFFISFVPVIGPIYAFFELGFSKGNRKSNHYGSVTAYPARPGNRKLIPAVIAAELIVLFVGVLISVGALFGVGGSATAGGPSQADAQAPVLVGTKQYSAAPPMLIDTTKQYSATVTMAKGGQFVIQLFADKAPITVNSFVFLARQGYFDGVTFHRVLSGFMAQGGDPTGTGMGGPGYEFVYENSGLTFDKAGVVAMANTGPQTPTNGSQFFITFGPQPQLNGGYTIFGQVISGMEVVNAITPRNPDDNPTFSGDAMQSVTIAEK